MKFITVYRSRVNQKTPAEKALGGLKVNPHSVLFRIETCVVTAVLADWAHRWSSHWDRGHWDRVPGGFWGHRPWGCSGALEM